MAAITFDTLRFARKLKEAGVSDKQAEAEAAALAEVFTANLADLATKRDLEKFATKQDIRDLELKIMKIDGELRPLKWMMGIILPGVVSLVMRAFFTA